MKHGSLSLCIIMTCTLKCVCYYNEITHDLTILFISLPPSLSFISHPSLSLSLRAYKILLIGESSVGKTTIATRLCEDRFMSEARQHTLG